MTNTDPRKIQKWEDNANRLAAACHHIAAAATEIAYALKLIAAAAETLKSEKP